MEDLINEEEFLPKKSSYNPWRIFKAFYAITFSELILLVIISTQISDDYGFLVALLCIFLPVVTAKAMFFYKKENTLLSYRIIALGVVLQLFIFYIPIIAVTVIS